MSPVERARSAAAGWAARTVEERAALLRPLAGRLADDAEQLADLIHTENGKPRSEAMTHDVVASIVLTRWVTEAAPRALAPRSVATPGQPHRRATVVRRPYGVVVAITPWNIPLMIPLSSVLPALLAGNVVVLKPSELTPNTGAALAAHLDALGLPEGVFQLVQGDGAVGAALVDAQPDKVVFTGSVPTGRRVMAACARFPIPVTLELGGVDALIVRADADLELAASAIAWGATFNGGQACCSVERVLVHVDVYGKLLARVTEKLGRIDPRADLGPAVDDRQRGVWSTHLADARARGLVAAGGDWLGPRTLAPTLVAGEGVLDCVAWREETFGPIVAAAPYRSDDEAVALHDGTPYGLTASVFGRDVTAATALARRLRAGAVAVNEVAATVYAHPQLPWGGVGASGFGRSHGEAGLLDLTWPQVIDTPRLPHEPKPLWGYPYDDVQERALLAVGHAFARPAPRTVLRAARAVGRLLTHRPRL